MNAAKELKEQRQKNKKKRMSEEGEKKKSSQARDEDKQAELHQLTDVDEDRERKREKKKKDKKLRHQGVEITTEEELPFKQGRSGSHWEAGDGGGREGKSGKHNRVEVVNGGGGMRGERGDMQTVKKKEKRKNVLEDEEDGDDVLVPQVGEGHMSNGKGSKHGQERQKGKGGKAHTAKESGNGVAVQDEGKQEGTFGALGVTVSGKGWKDLQPTKTFEAAGFPKALLASCAGFDKPSPIQSHAWPVLLAKRDLIGIAKTGSGKTLAFALPALVQCLDSGRKRGGAEGQSQAKKKRNTDGKGGQTSAKCQPLCLVLAPTRELAQQSAGVFEEAGRACQISCACVFGGASKGQQRALLESRPDVIVATPGRLMDFMEEEALLLDKVFYLVLDEADRMLDLGFQPAIAHIVASLPKERQTVMLSATWPPAVGQMAAQYLRDPIKVTVGSEELTANHDVKQVVEVLEDQARDARLETLLRTVHKSRTNRVLVFVLYKKEAVRVENMLQNRGWKVASIHGDKSQDLRNKAVAHFKDGSVPLLVATDVAARGLDIPNVEYVINYSFPLTTEDYVHRIGRTGRAGNKGTAFTFFTHNDRSRAGELVNILREAKQEVPEGLLKFGTHVKKQESKLYGAHFKAIGADAPKATKKTFDSDED